jgi:murein L,D-transpeptidase YcbB/YkuD
MSFVRLVAAVLVLLSAACSEPVRVAVAPPPPDPRPPFERLLDAHGVPFAPPRAGKAILVNIPAYEAIAFEDGHVVMRSRVIVGSVRNPTPVTDTYTTAVRFRPTWRPTPTMVASGEYEDKVWPAGRRNPLGLAAIRFEPGMLVYMHDTNRRGLFDREGRALSHGCVRTERWDDFAAWLLDIPVAQVHAYAEGRRTFDAPTEPVPVMIRYYTAFPDASGRLVRHPDIYRRGETVLTPATQTVEIAGSIPELCDLPPQ